MPIRHQDKDSLQLYYQNKKLARAYHGANKVYESSEDFYPGKVRVDLKRALLDQRGSLSYDYFFRGRGVYQAHISTGNYVHKLSTLFGSSYGNFMYLKQGDELLNFILKIEYLTNSIYGSASLFLDRDLGINDLSLEVNGNKKTSVNPVQTVSTDRINGEQAHYYVFALGNINSQPVGNPKYFEIKIEGTGIEFGGVVHRYGHGYKKTRFQISKYQMLKDDQDIRYFKSKGSVLEENVHTILSSNAIPSSFVLRKNGQNIGAMVQLHRDKIELYIENRDQNIGNDAILSLNGNNYLLETANSILTQWKINNDSNIIAYTWPYKSDLSLNEIDFQIKGEGLEFGSYGETPPFFEIGPENVLASGSHVVSSDVTSHNFSSGTDNKVRLLFNDRAVPFVWKIENSRSYLYLPRSYNIDHNDIKLVVNLVEYSASERQDENTLQINGEALYRYLFPSQHRTGWVSLEIKGQNIKFGGVKSFRIPEIVHYEYPFRRYTRSDFRALTNSNFGFSIRLNIAKDGYPDAVAYGRIHQATILNGELDATRKLYWLAISELTSCVNDNITPSGGIRIYANRENILEDSYFGMSICGQSSLDYFEHTGGTKTTDLIFWDPRPGQEGIKHYRVRKNVLSIDSVNDAYEDITNTSETLRALPNP